MGWESILQNFEGRLIMNLEKTNKILWTQNTNLEQWNGELKFLELEGKQLKTVITEKYG